MTASRPAEPILHVDMDAFYASVEVREDPSLAGKPVAVGGGGPRGVVTSASYEARAFGVRSAMPTVRARRLCPDLVVVPPNFAMYGVESRAVMDIFLSFTPFVEQVSLDEAFLDVAGSVRLFGDPVQIAAKVRERIADERRLVASVGVGPNKLIAKMASRRAKPDGICHVPVSEIAAFLDPMDVREMWGIGEATATALDRLGVRTIGDIHALPPGILERAFGPNQAAHLEQVSRGEDRRVVTPHEPAKQISAEQTFERDLDATAHIHRELLRMSDRVAGRLRAEGFGARTIQIKVRFSDFRTITRSKTLSEPTDVAAKVYATARDLYGGLKLFRPRIRLLGVSAGNLVQGDLPEQLRMGERPDPWRAADRAVDTIRKRFGGDEIERAAVSRWRPKKGGPSGGSGG